MRAPRLTALLLPLLVAPALTTVTVVSVATAPAASAAVADLRINEVESNGGTPVDWVELVNTGTAPVDAGGLRLKDDNDTRTFAVPAGTVVAPGGFVAVDVDVAGGFGLGAADVARLFAADGTTLLDSYGWPAHAATTYARCADGTGAFRTSAAPTKGAANDCSSPLRISEIESSGGVPGDWIELVNTGAEPVDAGGLRLKDDDDSRTFTVPAGTTVAAGGYAAVDVDVTGGFGLGSADTARLFAADGTTLIDSYAWTAHATTTYGRCPNPQGAFTTTTSPTKGAANDCGVVVPAGLRINEVESNGDLVGDFAELKNTGTTPVDISGYRFRDNDLTRTPYVVPAGTVVAPGAWYVLAEAAFGFGLGGADSATVLLPDGTTVVDSYSWTAHASTSYGRCPDGTGAFTTTGASTRGASNDCTSAVRINEVESSGGTPGDWVELVNTATTVADVSGLRVTDSGEPGFTFPAGTTIAAGGRLVVEEAQIGSGLGASDSARLLAADGTTLDSYSWTAHATTSYGRCPDGTGAFTTTQLVTKGVANNCPGDLVTAPWPGGPDVTTVDPQGTFASNLSGLAYEPSGSAAPGTLWAVRNGPGALFRLVPAAGGYAPAPGEGAGRLLTYADGTGDVDAEGITFTAAGPAGGAYVATERNNAVSSVSRPAVLRFPTGGSGASLRPTNDWDLSTDLPGLGANLGLEAIAWVPDSYLAARGFVDQRTGAAYDPAGYPGHGSGLFLVGVEQTGQVLAYALDQTPGSGAFTRVATIASGFPAVMDLHFEAETQQLWVVCDDTCQGRSAVFEVTGGAFTAQTYYERPTGMPNLNNEGFTLAPRAECAGGRKPAFWSDDSSTGGFAVRRGTVRCTDRVGQTVTFTSTPPAAPVVGQTYAVTATGGASGNPVRLSEDSAACTLDGSTVTIVAPGPCTVVASQAGDADRLDASAAQTRTAVAAATTVALTVRPDSLRAAVAVTAPGAAPVSGDVTFLVDDVVVGSAPVVGGVATLSTVVAPGAVRTVVARYAGSTLLEGSSGTVQRRDPLVRAALSSSVPVTAEGWWSAPVTVTFTCTPQGAPVLACPEPVLLDESGTDLGVTRTAAAADGGVGTVVVAGVKVDLDAPRARVGGVRDGATYELDAPRPTCVASDALSGVASCRLTTSTRGLVTTVTATAVDVAGRTARSSVTWRRPLVRVADAVGVTAAGRYVVERGASYRLVALLGRRPVPTVGGDPMRAGEVTGGLVTWTDRFRATGPRDQRLVVRAGGRRLVVLLRLL